MKPLSRDGWYVVALATLISLGSTALQLWISVHMGTHGAMMAGLIFLLGCCTLAAAAFIPTHWPREHARGIFGLTVAGTIALMMLPDIRFCRSCAAGIFPVVLALWTGHWRGRGAGGLACTLAGEAVLVVLSLLLSNGMALLCLILTGLVLQIMAARRDFFQLGKKYAGRIILLAAVVAVLLLGLQIFVSWPVLRSRVFCPRLDPQGQGYLAITVRQILGQARFLGNGVWDPGLFPWNFVNTLPDWQNSSLLTTMIFYGGWLPFLVILAETLVLCIWILRRGLNQRNPSACFASTAVAVTLLTGLVCSVLWNLGLPLLRADFPLLAGNGSVVCAMGLVGFTLSACREPKKE